MSFNRSPQLASHHAAEAGAARTNSARTAKTAREIETWVDGGTSRIWVRVPQIIGLSQVDHIWLYYDNPGAAYEQTLADEQDVWSNSYRAVWHLRETDIRPGASYPNPCR